jgi:hypothetical protein
MSVDWPALYIQREERRDALVYRTKAFVVLEASCRVNSRESENAACFVSGVEWDQPNSEYIKMAPIGQITSI